MVMAWILYGGGVGRARHAPETPNYNRKSSGGERRNAGREKLPVFSPGLLMLLPAGTVVGETMINPARRAAAFFSSQVAKYRSLPLINKYVR
jgi:hypothetical protein